MSTVVWAPTRDAAVQWAERLADGSMIAFDLETTGLRPHGLPNDEIKPAVVMMTMSGFTGSTALLESQVDVVIPLSHPDSAVRLVWQDVLRDVMGALVETGVPLAAQNGIFDLAWIYTHTGLEVPLGFDTEIAGRLIDENRSNRLESLAVDLLGAPEWKTTMDFSKRRADQTDLWELGVYAANDTHWTLRLAMHLRHTMGEELYRLMQTMCRALPALVQMQDTGIRLDQAAADRALVEAETAHDQALSALAAMWPDIDGTPSAQAGGWLSAVMEASVAAGESVVVERTARGAPSWTASTLGRQKTSRTASLVLEARDAAKRAQFLRQWAALTSSDGVIHPSYRVTSTVTGRLSSAGPNCQQIARSQKHLFVPPEHHRILDVDYSQLELRIIAHMAESEPMRAAFRNGDDLHRMLAARLTGKRPEDVTKEERQFGKTVNFELAFGGSAMKLQAIARDAGIDMPIDQAEAAYRLYLDTWDLDRWRRVVLDWVEAEGQIGSPVGRVRHLPDIWSRSKKIRSEAFRQALNAPVQGFGCDMGLIGLGLLHEHMPPDFQLVSTVHDSFQAYVPDDAAETYLEAMMNVLTEGVYRELDSRFGVKFAVPIAVEGSVETAWGVPVPGTTREVSYYPERGDR